MIMQESYKEDMMEHLRQADDTAFHDRRMAVAKEELLKDDSLIEQLWYQYQKDVSEYDCDPEYAWADALDEVLGPKQIKKKAVSS